MPVSEFDVTIDTNGVLVVTDTGIYNVTPFNNVSGDIIESISGAVEHGFYELRVKTNTEFWTIHHNATNGIFLHRQLGMVTSHVRDFICLRGTGIDEVQEFTRGEFGTT